MKRSTLLLILATVGCGGPSTTPTTPANQAEEHDAGASDELFASLEAWQIESDAPGGTMSIVEDSLGGKSEVTLTDLTCRGAGDTARCDADVGQLDGAPAGRLVAALRAFDASGCDADVCHAEHLFCERAPVDVDVDLEPKTTRCTLEAP